MWLVGITELRYTLKTVFEGAGLAQLVERDLPKVEAVGSSPITRSNYFFIQVT